MKLTPYSVLWCGQKQRIILASTLCRRPNLVLHYETTSHRNINCERLVSAVVKRLVITRIVIAHRTETIADTQQVLVMTDGAVQPIPSPTREVKVEGSRSRYGIIFPE